MGGILIAPSALVARLRPPSGITESTRWLFGVLGVVSAVLTVAPSLIGPDLSDVFVALASGAVLVGSWTYGYLARSVPVWSDVVDAVALLGIAAASPDPSSAVALIFAAVWYRALYGSTRRSLLRCGLYMMALAASLALWPRLPGHLDAPPPAVLLSVFPFMIITMLVGRQLGLGLAAREASLGRNTVLAATGSELLGMTDASAIRNAGRRALSEICAATPGMCLIATVDEGPKLRIERIIGARAAAAPTTFPACILDPANSARIEGTALLNAAVGTALRWTGLQVSYDGERRHLLVGAKRTPHGDVLLALQSLYNQIALALSNSDVHEDLSTQARVDALTGLVNRATFIAELTTRVTRGDHAQAQVLFIDLDDFKLVNDEMGHQSGDKVLAEVALRLQNCSRPHGVCARLGGDEFAILLPGASAHDAQQIAQRMVERIADPIDVGGDSAAHVGASIGIACADAEAEIATVVNHADVAMYAAKALGKGRIQVFREGLLTNESPRADIERKLVNAVAAGEIVVHYQPILATHDRTCRGVEALLRWQHPDRGLLEPTDFLHIAERTGAIVDIGAFVLRQACSDAVRFDHAQPGVVLSLHVNVQAIELEHETFLERVHDCLTHSGLPATQLVLELSGNISLNSVTIVSRIKALTELGVRIAIDVGTDQFPLAALRSLPIGVIKIDQSFLDSAATDAVDRAAAHAIVQISTQRAIQTIAVRVERVEQQNLLTQLGIDAMQGYLHLRPVTTAHLCEWLVTNLRRTPSTSATVTTLHSRITA